MSSRQSLTALSDWLYAEDPLQQPEVGRRARLLFLDTLGCFIAAQTKTEPRSLAATYSDLDPGDVSLPGLAHPVSAQSATMLLALGACWDEACEGLARAHGRPGLHALPPALAVGLARGLSFGEVLRAMVTGFEIGGRMGEALRIKGGMHVDGAWGALGAAAAAARASGGTAADCVRAVETTACQVPFSLYAPVAAGETARNTYCGHGAVLGLLSALSALSGIGAPPNALDDYHRIALGHDAAPKIAPPGGFYLLQGYLKPYAAVRHVHYGAQCAIDWRRQHAHDMADITALKLHIYQEAITYCGNRNPQAAIQAQFSLSYGLAHALVTGDLGPEAYTAEALANPEIRRIEAMLEIVVDQDLTAREARGASLQVTLPSGVQTIAVDQVAGDPELLLDDAAVSAKFVRYTSPVLGHNAAEALAAKIATADFNMLCREIF